MSKVYLVEGMSCSGCSTSVTNALKAISPECEVHIDLETKKVSIAGLDDEAAIRDAIEDAGFDFKGAV